jgi:DNA-binding transcriptional regulator YdaS (Cro superfamily)
MRERAQAGLREGAVPSVHAQTLRRAAEIVGGEQELALRLKVTPRHLHLWLKVSRTRQGRRSSLR